MQWDFAILCKCDADFTLFNVIESDKARSCLYKEDTECVDLHNNRLINHRRLITWGSGGGSLLVLLFNW